MLPLLLAAGRRGTARRPGEDATLPRRDTHAGCGLRVAGNSRLADS